MSILGNFLSLYMMLICMYGDLFNFSPIWKKPSVFNVICYIFGDIFVKHYNNKYHLIDGLFILFQ